MTYQTSSHQTQTYQSINDLPETLQTTLPPKAQEIYLEAYNDAMLRTNDMPQGSLSPESTAHTVGWRAVEKDYEQDQKSGQWYAKGETMEGHESEEKGILDQIKDMFMPQGVG